MQIKYIDLIALSQTLRRELLLKADMTKQEFLEKLDIERNLEIRIKDSCGEEKWEISHRRE